jgi:hypothetical protein
MTILKIIFPCCFRKSSFWHFKRAPEPSDINWQNLGVSTLRRICQTGMIYIITSGILVACAFIINSIKLAEDDVLNDPAN